MKIKTLFVSMAYVAMYTMVSSCSNEEGFINSGEVTAFSGTMVSETPITRVSFNAPNTPISTFLPATRTSMNRTEVGGKGVFLWEPGDYIFVEDDNNKAFKSQNTATESQPRNTFFVNGSYTGKTSYNVYYNGTNSGTNPKQVVIAPEQIQSQFNNTTHFGKSGDCGVAVAQKNTEGGKAGYKFDLTHKASYICFLPYIKEQAQRQNYKIQKIELSSNINIAGTYNLSTTGISGEGSLNTITLRAGNNGLPLANQRVDAPNTDNSLYMVVAPGTHVISVKYTIFDTATNQTLSYTKKYGRRTFDPNKIYDIAVNLDLTAFDGGHNETDGTETIDDANVEFFYSGHEFYMWDAKENFWSGHEWDSKDPLQLTENDSNTNNYLTSKESSPNRWYNDNLNTNNASTPLFQSLPSANEMAWYVMHGDAHWDETTQWKVFGKVYTGGIWLKKIDIIAKEQGKTRKELKAKAPDGIDNNTAKNFSFFSGYDNEVKYGKPSSRIAEYFFLPALGYCSGYHDFYTFDGLGNIGWYWPSTSTREDTNVLPLYFDKGNIGMDGKYSRDWIYVAMPFK